MIFKRGIETETPNIKAAVRRKCQLLSWLDTATSKISKRHKIKARDGDISNKDLLNVTTTESLYEES